MELKYVVMTLIKILISVPTVVLVHSLIGYNGADGAALMGGHFDNKNSTNFTNSYLEYDSYENDDAVMNSTDSKEQKTEDGKDSEEIPNPSPLVLPGYNLPENIFNKGKPFYLEKDPLTGNIDFNSKTPSAKFDEDLYDYVDDEPSDDIYDKSNINRKDGSIGSHRPSDVNQLTPNFHDFLNLPVKYNSDKYVYPLISSSYANTKIQGNVNKFHNHKDYNQKTTTKKPTYSPTYYSTNKNYFTEAKRPITSTTSTTTTTTTTTTTARPTTKKPVQEIYLTTKTTNLLNSAMYHPINEEFGDYYEPTKKPYKPNEIYLTTENINNIYLTSKIPSTTTKKEMSLFEQLFGDYDETVTTTEKTKPPTLFQNLPNKKNTNTKFEKDDKGTTPVYAHYPNSHAGPNILMGSNMGIDTDDYDDDYDVNKHHEDNIAVENKPVTKVDTTTSKVNSKYTVTTMKPVKEVVKPETTKKPIYKTTTPNKDTSTKSSEMFSTEYPEYDYEEKLKIKTTAATTSAPTTTTKQITSLPLGENHFTSFTNKQPIIVATQNLKEKLNSEMVLPNDPKPFGFEKPVVQNAPSTSNIHIAPDQDTVSFVVGNHQNVDGGQYVGTSLKESPYDSNPFRPFYGQNAVSYQIQDNQPIQHFNEEKINLPEFPDVSAGSSVTIQPLKNSEASLSIGVPVSGAHKVPGQVVDEKLELDDDKIEFPKGTGAKIVFPDERDTTVANLVPPSPPQTLPLPPPPPSNREVLKLNSKPMYHQLPSDLTPPKEKDQTMPPRFERPRPPWDPRPGHFYSGKPEYNRPPRPPTDHAFKRIDNLPNILPQFRPNMQVNHHPPHYYRQPLLERPSNRPIGFFEKLQPPPPPPPHLLHNLHHIRKVPPPPPQSLDDTRPIMAEDRIMNEGGIHGRKPLRPEVQDQFGFFHSPPKVVLANRRNGIEEGEVETLQMIQAKNADKKEILSNEPVTQTTTTEAAAEEPVMPKDTSEKPLYVVYPVNTPPIKLDVIESNKKEAVVIGTRAELPLPPSVINTEFNYEQDRNEAPILKPHPRPPTFPVKSDFPYPLERPDPSILHPAVPETSANNLDVDEPNFISGNQWNTMGENIESRIVSGGSKINSNQISATLKTYTEKPIAVAYTPTEPHNIDQEHSDRFSMPNYASPVIPEIRPGSADGADKNEFTVSAVMHTHPQFGLGTSEYVKPEYVKPGKISDEPIFNININHKSDNDLAKVPSKLDDFQAPFQASVNIDSSLNQGWAVVREKNKTTTEAAEVTTIPFATTSEFDIENFKPQLEGGFKPIYNYPHSDKNESQVNERQE